MTISYSIKRFAGRFGVIKTYTSFPAMDETRFFPTLTAAMEYKNRMENK